jgi:molybdopterin molybdotransferase
MASIGATQVLVKKLPKVVIVSTGDELVEVTATPLPYQIRRSNNYTIKAVLQQYELHPQLLHIPDDPNITKQQLEHCLQEYDVIILSGGISMGKFDYVPEALEALNVQKLFHKVQQRPGKPFWFGKHQNGVLVFAFPGNPVSTFMCLHRYFLPWLKTSLGLTSIPALYAQLAEDITFTPPLHYFLQVQIQVNDKGVLIATPIEGNGSGDFANLTETDAFMELPAEQNTFTKGSVFRIWPFKQWY